VKVVTRLVDKEVPLVVLRQWYPGLLHFILDCLRKPLLLPLFIQRRDHTDGQDVVDQLKEPFLLDMCIGQ
jgi:hypothetical protein